MADQDGYVLDRNADKTTLTDAAEGTMAAAKKLNSVARGSPVAAPGAAFIRPAASPPPAAGFFSRFGSAIGSHASALGARVATLPGVRTIASGMSRVANSSVVQGAGRVMGVVARSRVGQFAGRIAGRAFVPVMAAIAVYQGYEGYKTGDTKKFAAAVGDAGGGFAGALGGAAAGAALGVGFLGIGAVPGAIIGGIAGSLGGSWIGRKTAGLFFGTPADAAETHGGGHGGTTTGGNQNGAPGVIPGANGPQNAAALSRNPYHLLSSNNFGNNEALADAIVGAMLGGAAVHKFRHGNEHDRERISRQATEAWQHRLNDHGAHIKVDGDFGPQTGGATNALAGHFGFQGAHSLPGHEHPGGFVDQAAMSAVLRNPAALSARVAGAPAFGPAGYSQIHPSPTLATPAGFTGTPHDFQSNATRNAAFGAAALGAAATAASLRTLHSTAQTPQRAAMEREFAFNTQAPHALPPIDPRANYAGMRTAEVAPRPAATGGFWSRVRASAAARSASVGNHVGGGMGFHGGGGRHF